MQLSHQCIPIMLDIMDRHNNGEDVTRDLNQLLDHEDYVIQFEFFNNHHANIGFTKEEYINFFKNINTITPDDLSSKALSMRINDIKHIKTNTGYYRMVYNKVKAIDENHLNKAVEWVNNGLPEPIDATNIKQIVAIGLGVTGGFNYKHHCFYDLKVTCSDKSTQGILHTIAHEMYHEGFKANFSGKVDFLQCTPAGYLAYLLSQKGLAVKHGNNFEGILTKRIRHDDEMTVNQVSYDYYIKNFTSIYSGFQNDMVMLQSINSITKEEVEDLFVKHYLYRDVMIDGQMRKFYLRNPITYHLGADIWGVIYDMYGKEKIADIMLNLDQFANVFNNALRTINKNELLI